MLERRLRVLGLIAIWLIGLLGVAVAPVAAGGTRAEQLGPRLQSVIENQRQSINIPGVSAAVIFGDGSRWSGFVGQSTVSPSTPVARSTPFVVGSITKTFVASLILKLAEDSVLAIDGPLSDWLPDYPNAANITLRHLLSHTSGVFNYFDHPDYGSLVFGNPSRLWTPAEILTRFARAPYFAPGAGYRYSNTNYVLLGLVAQAAGGAPIGEQLSARLWAPLGLLDTSIQAAGPPPASAARGYLMADGRFRDVGDDSGYRPTVSAASVAWSVGDVVSSADDIATWVHALYGGEVLTDASLAEMTDWERYPGGEDYGLGTRMRLHREMELFGHTGSIRGYVAAAWHVPAHDASVVVLTNRGRTDAHVTITNAVLDAALLDVTAPTVPTGLAGEGQGLRYVQITWHASTDDFPGVIRYRVFRNGRAIGSRTTQVSFVDRPSSVGMYRYQVRAIDAAGNRSNKSPQITVHAFK